MKDTLFSNTSLAAANASLALVLDVAARQGFFIAVSANLTNVNDELSVPTGDGDDEVVPGSRLFPTDVYRNTIAAGEPYLKIFDRVFQGA
jgi:hypothetical protein